LAVGGIGVFPFYKAEFHLPPRFGSSIEKGGRQGAGGRYAACTWLFLVAMWTLKRLGEGIFRSLSMIDVRPFDFLFREP